MNRPRPELDADILVAAAEYLSPNCCGALLDTSIPAEHWLGPDAETSMLPSRVRARLADRRNLEREARTWVESARTLGLDVLTPSSPHWPERLRRAALQPRVLFVRGDPSILDTPSPQVAVIGSRSPTDYGERTADAFGDALVLADCSIWSGLALGVDAAAHNCALRANEPTVAVLAGGLDQVDPPSHDGLAKKIVATGGALVAEMPPGLRPRKAHFPRRNRILAAATDAVLVIEAGLRSGTTHTAHFAAECGTAVYAVPGPWYSPRSVGCHRLIADGAFIASSPDEVLRSLGIAKTTRTLDAHRLELGADCAAVLSTLARGPRPRDVSERESGLGHRDFLVAVERLLSQRLVQPVAGDRLARVG